MVMDYRSARQNWWYLVNSGNYPVNSYWVIVIGFMIHFSLIGKGEISLMEDLKVYPRPEIMYYIYSVDFLPAMANPLPHHCLPTPNQQHVTAFYFYSFLTPRFWCCWRLSINIVTKHKHTHSQATNLCKAILSIRRLIPRRIINCKTDIIDAKNA